VKIKELRLQNYRIFKDQTFSFSDRVTVIAGVNGRGKSSVLESISLLLSKFIPIAIQEAKYEKRKASELDINYQAKAFRVDINLNIGPIPIEYFAKREKGKKTTTFKVVSSGVAKALVDQTSINSPISVYYSTDRARYPERIGRLPTLKQCDKYKGRQFAFRGALVNQSIDFQDFALRFRNMVDYEKEWYQDHAKTKSPIEISKMQANNPVFIGHKGVGAIRKCITEFLGEYHFGTLNYTEEENSLTIIKSLSNGIKGSLDSFDLRQLSDGERSLIAMLMDLSKRLAIANPNRSNPLEGEGIVMIDEVELHLHPKWQREVIEKFRTIFPNIQFIMTTHSPFVIQSLRKGELRLLGNDIDSNDLIPPEEYSNRGLEEVAKNIQDIDEPNLTPRYIKMLDAARNYYRALEGLKHNGGKSLIKLENALNELIEPYPDEPAYRAFLELHKNSVFSDIKRAQK